MPRKTLIPTIPTRCLPSNTKSNKEKENDHNSQNGKNQVKEIEREKTKYKTEKKKKDYRRTSGSRRYGMEDWNRHGRQGNNHR